MQRVGEVVIKTENCTTLSSSADAESPLDCSNRGRLICLQDFSTKSSGRTMVDLARNSGSHSSSTETQCCGAQQQPLIKLRPKTWRQAMREANVGVEQNVSSDQRSIQTQQLNKLKRFLATIQQFGDGLSIETGDIVRGLVIAVATDVIGVEEFHDRLRKATNLPLRPFVIPFLQTTLPLLRDELGFDFRKPPSGVSPPPCDSSSARVRATRSPTQAAAPSCVADQRTIGDGEHVTNGGNESRFNPGLVQKSGDVSEWIPDDVSGQLKATNNSTDRSEESDGDLSQSLFKRRRLSKDSINYASGRWDVLNSGKTFGSIRQRLLADMAKPPLSWEALLRSNSTSHDQSAPITVLPPDVRRQQPNGGVPEYLSRGGWLSREPEDGIALNLRGRCSNYTNDISNISGKWQHVNQVKLDTTKTSTCPAHTVSWLLDEILLLVGRCHEALYRLQQRPDRKEVRNYDAIGATSGENCAVGGDVDGRGGAHHSVGETHSELDGSLACQLAPSDVLRAAYSSSSSTARNNPTIFGSAPPIPATATGITASVDLEQLLADVRQQTAHEVRNFVNQQINSIEYCWNCGRTATETCSGCRRARYCGTFCQHRHWCSHHRSCRPPVTVDQVLPATIVSVDTAGEETISSISSDSTPIVDDRQTNLLRTYRMTEMNVSEPTPSTRLKNEDNGNEHSGTLRHRLSLRRRKIRRAVMTSSHHDGRNAALTSTTTKHHTGKRELPASYP